MSSSIILSGIKPTNRLTLGNYLGAIHNWCSLQHQHRAYFMAVDLHSITVRQDPKELHENTLLALATYIASGIDPDKALLFIQSHVHQHAELAWILNCYSYMGELSRMTQYKDKSAKAGANIPTGLFTYPALMAADILLYDTNLVPVGSDQKQHIELCRDLAQRMNQLYGDDLFVIPEPVILGAGARIMDLQDPTAKMGKSDSSEGGAVFLMDDPKTIQKKFKRAVTDSGQEIIYSDDKPGIKNLLNIQMALTGSSQLQLVQQYQGKMYGHLKIDTADIVINALRPIQDRLKELMSDRHELLKIFENAAHKASLHAEQTLARVYQRIGLVAKGRAL